MTTSWVGSDMDSATLNPIRNKKIYLLLVLSV